MSEKNDILTADERTEADQQAIAEVIEKSHVAMVTTVNEEGSLVSRPLALQKRDFDGDLFFFVPDPSDKAEQVRAHEMTNVAIQSHNSYLSLAGSASITKDQALIEEFWNPHAEAWFDGGRDDPTVALLKVHVDSAELQSTDHFRPLAMAKYAKAMVTKDQPDLGDATRVEL